MKTLILYGSSRGATRRLVAGLGEILHFEFDARDVRDLEDPTTLLDYDFVVWFCPTYGDDEVQEDVEAFLRRFDLDLAGRYFAVCRIGSSDGYAFFEPAGGRILREELLDHGGVEAVPALALDTTPTLDRKRLGAWCETLDAWVAAR